MMMNTRRFQHGYPAGRPAEPWTQLTHTERLPEWVAYNPRIMRPPPLSSDTNSMKILSYNVNGLQAAVQLGFSALELAHNENFDVLCLQETHLEASFSVPMLFFFPDGLCCFNVIQTIVVTRYIMAWVIVVVFSYDNLCQFHDHIVMLFSGGRC
jgi:hypothetical protein